MGYGRELMQVIERLAKREKADAIELDYWISNKGAKEFYKQDGYEVYRECVHKYL